MRNERKVGRNGVRIVSTKSDHTAGVGNRGQTTFLLESVRNTPSLARAIVKSWEHRQLGPTTSADAEALVLLGASS